MRAEEPSQPGNLRAAGPDVFYCHDAVVRADKQLIDFLKASAQASPRRRSRLCAHPDSSAPVHEMLIVHHREVYVRPHRHLGKAESLHLIEGRASLVFFENDGRIRNAFGLDADADADGDAPFFFRIPAGVIHSLIIYSRWLVFHETTAGPFDRSTTEFPIWAPADRDVDAVNAFLAGLMPAVRSFLAVEAAPTGA